MDISDGYKLIKRMGGQSKRKFGEVYLLEHKETKALAIMKVVQKNLKSLHLIERLRQESTFSFDQSGLPVTIHLEESDQGTHYLRSYVPGVQIDEHWKTLKKRERLPFLIEVLKLLDPLFNRLKKEEIVHCDIKPSNILITEAGDKLSVHIIDFGLALNKNKLENRSILFPLGFAAPELLLNHLDLVDHTTDIYSLGIMIWRLYTGKLPLVHPNPSVFTNLQLTHPLPDHSELPSKVYTILYKMSYKHSFQLPPNRMDANDVRIKLQNAQKKRYQHLQEIISDFEAIRRKRWW